MNSMPSKYQHRVSFLPKRLQLDNNPYVGSFRHSPPTSLRSIAASMHRRHSKRQNAIACISRHAPMRNSPYVGWFRHAPPSNNNFTDMTRFDLRWIENYRALAMIIAKLAINKKTRSGLAQFINACLYGIGKGNPCMDAGFTAGTTGNKHTNDLAYLSLDTTTSLLAKIGSWFPFPMTYDSLEYRKMPTQGRADSRVDDSSSESDDDSEQSTSCDREDDLSSSALSDFDAPMTISNSTAISKPIDISLSEIAEAYHGHQDVQVHGRDALGGDRLDYVITQADIARMARNASKHLDVESILNLPTITYRTQNAFQRSQRNQLEQSRGPGESWSIILMPTTPTDSINEHGTSDGVNDTVCVICLEKFKDGDRLRVLPCNHSFHVGCIDRWLSGSQSHDECFTSGCPTCKKRPQVPLAPVADTCPEIFGNDGSVPSWAFAKLGSQMAQSLDC